LGAGDGVAEAPLAATRHPDGPGGVIGPKDLATAETRSFAIEGQTGRSLRTTVPEGEGWRPPRHPKRGRRSLQFGHAVRDRRARARWLFFLLEAVPERPARSGASADARNQDEGGGAGSARESQ
jgi:hypothetical protein